MSNTNGLLTDNQNNINLSLQEKQSKMNTSEEDNDNTSLSPSIDIEADDIDDITDSRTCRKTSYPHIFQLYMFSSNLFSPGSFTISSSNKFYWERITEAHNISVDKLNSEIKELNRLVLWYMFLPKLLWIIPWICLPIGVVIYAVEDGYKHNHKDATEHELNYHLFWSYNGLFIFVGGGIGGVLLATQLWNHCWYLCIKAMAKKINSLNNNDLWLNKYCVTFDIQCDIPVLAGRSYGRAYYKVVITIHHDYLIHHNKPMINDNENNTNNIPPQSVIRNKSGPQIITLKQPTSVDDTMSTAISNENELNNTNTNNLDLLQSLTTSILRRNESQRLNVNLGMDNSTEIPRTMSVTHGHITNTQMKMNYARPKHMNITRTGSAPRLSMTSQQDEIKEEKKEEIIENEQLQIEKTNKSNQKIKKKKHDKKTGKKEIKETKEIKEIMANDASNLTGTHSSSLFNIGGFVTQSVLNDDKSGGLLLRDKMTKKKSKKKSKKKAKKNNNDSLSNNIKD